MSTIYLPNPVTYSNAVSSAHINSTVSGLNWQPSVEGVGLLYFLSKLGIKSAAAAIGGKLQTGSVLVDSLSMNAYIIGANQELIRFLDPSVPRTMVMEMQYNDAKSSSTQTDDSPRETERDTPISRIQPRCERFLVHDGADEPRGPVGDRRSRTPTGHKVGYSVHNKCYVINPFCHDLTGCAATAAILNLLLKLRVHKYD